MDLNKYKTFLFDCDGVILDSNKIKTKTFYDIALPYGKEYADELVNYHVSNGGVSRFKKFEYFYCNILNKEKNDVEINYLIDKYGETCIENIKKCGEMPGVFEFLRTLNSRLCHVVSGGKQDDLIEIFGFRGLNIYFNTINGSPKTKEEILQNMTLNHPIIFFGDSEYDYRVSKQFGCDFVFLSSLTEFEGYEKFFEDKNVAIYKTFSEFMCDLKVT